MLRTIHSLDLQATRAQIVIAPHHPDRLRRPLARPGAIESDQFRQALLWNIFRTFELLPPAFWLRRLHARLRTAWFPPAAQTVRVDLWRALTLPPNHRLDGARPHIVADVMIETEHVAWTLMLGGNESRHIGNDSAKADYTALLIDATSWYAGTRDCLFGVISDQSAYQDAAIALVECYFRSKESLRLRSEGRGNLLSNVRGVGSLGWKDLAAVLRDCEQADVYTHIERELARNVVTWLERVAIG